MLINIVFCRVRKDEDRRRKWLQGINRNNVPRTGLLCSNHFKPSDYQKTVYGLRSRLKKTAIPRIISQKTICDVSNKAASSEEEFDI